MLVDAPCLGVGSWRRNPDAKWRATPNDLAELQIRQHDILASAARLVRPGGRLAYVTCSLLREENEAQAERFLAETPDFTLVPRRAGLARSDSARPAPAEATICASPRRSTAPTVSLSRSSNASPLHPNPRPPIPMTDKILILDFGSQVTQLIARRVRENGVYSEIHPYTMSTEAIRAFAPKGIILSGGPASVTLATTPRAPDIVFDLGVPVLAICYGMQTMCAQLGGRVTLCDSQEFGRAVIDIVDDSPLFEDLWPKGSRAQVWMSHGDRVDAIPGGFRVVAATDSAPYASIADDTRRFYGCLFHPEVVHTPQGGALLKNFTHRICGCSRRLDDGGVPRPGGAAHPRPGRRAGASCAASPAASTRRSPRPSSTRRSASGSPASLSIPACCGSARPRRSCACSAATTTSRSSTRTRATCSSASSPGSPTPSRSARSSAPPLSTCSTPRRTEIGGVEFLAQGTLYPDVIESVSATGGPSVTIKSHHNVGGLPERMKLKLVEPLRELFKDEVRELGRELGLPEHFVERHPFPGPGLAIRIPGEVTREQARDITTR